MSKPNTLLTKLGGSETRWLLNKIELTWEKIQYFIAMKGEVAPFYIIPRSI